MAQQGWIKIHRKLRECYIWDDKEPFDKRSAWIDLLLSANHADKKTLINNQAVLVNRGSFITSEIKLSERWKWDRGKTRRFLKLLEKDNMIKKDVTSRLFITVSIVNYDMYQSQDITENSDNNFEAVNEKNSSASATSESVDNTDLEPYNTTSREQVENKCATSNEQVTNINKNDKNEKNSKKSIIGVYTDNINLIKAINDFIDMRKQIKKPMTLRAVELMLKDLDKYADNDEIKIEILNQSIQNSWQGVFPLKNKKVANSKDWRDF